MIYFISTLVDLGLIGEIIYELLKIALGAPFEEVNWLSLGLAISLVFDDELFNQDALFDIESMGFFDSERFSAKKRVIILVVSTASAFIMRWLY